MDGFGSALLWSFLGGIVPACIWLWFWLREDFRHPEPARLIAMAFVGGMLIVPVAFILEKAANIYFSSVTLLFIIWATIEELLKYIVAYFIAFRKECIDRSRCLGDTIDPFIYLVTVALGFAALENTLYLFGPFSNGEPLAGFIAGNFRFIGAMVLHVVASASIGIALGFSFYKKPSLKKIYVSIGIFTAIALHSLFNLSIIKGIGDTIFITFGVLWFCVFILLALLEKLKKANYNQ